MKEGGREREMEEDLRLFKGGRRDSRGMDRSRDLVFWIHHRPISFVGASTRCAAC